MHIFYPCIVVLNSLCINSVARYIIPLRVGIIQYITDLYITCTELSKTKMYIQISPKKKKKKNFYKTFINPDTSFT